jgi:hypothetical protein
VADRSTHPPARATGVPRGGADDFFARVDRERFDDMTWDSFCVRLRPLVDLLLEAAPRGLRIATTSGPSPEGNVHRAELSRGVAAGNPTYETSHRRKSSAARLTSKARVVSALTPALYFAVDIASPCVRSEQLSETKPHRDALCSHPGQPHQANRPWKFTRYVKRDVRKVG